MKLRLLLCGLAGVAIALAIILWPETTTPYDQSYDPSNDKELSAVIAASERGEALQTLLAETPETQKRDMAFLLKNNE